MTAAVYPIAGSDDYALPTTTLNDGALMPLLGFGTGAVSDADAERSAAQALEAGYRHIDTATGYGNEAGIGRALAASAVARESVFLTTKMPAESLGQERRTLEESLAKLRVDHVDLWLIHWPPNQEATPKAWEQFVAARDEGLATSIGVSNYSLAQVDELTAATGVTPAVDQIRWSPALFDPTVSDGLAERDVQLEGYSPFKASDLENPTLTAIARDLGVGVTQVIVAWHVAHGFVVIPRSVNQDRIIANAAGARVTLSAAQVAAIDGTSSV